MAYPITARDGKGVSQREGQTNLVVVNDSVAGTLQASGAGTSRPAGMASEPDFLVMSPAFSKRPGQQIATRDDGLSVALTTGEPPRVLERPIEAMAWDSLNGSIDGDITHTLRAGTEQGIPRVGVRRVTPKECERLQGFDDDWTAGQGDSVRYRQLGNAVTVPVSKWIGERL